METLWFILVALMLAAYVVLDGFDLGVGIVAPWVAKGHAQRRLVLRTIGPVWDGNEVWLLAAGGTLFFAFPLLYASSFSGFYLPLMMVLWLLMLRGIGIELAVARRGSAGVVAVRLRRSRSPVSCWRSSSARRWATSSAACRWARTATSSSRCGRTSGSGPHPGILDWYTVLTGVLALVTLAVHGAHYLAMKTEGEIQARARRIAAGGWLALVALTVLSLVATLSVRPQVLDNFRAYPWGWIVPLGVLASLAAMPLYRSAGTEPGRVPRLGGLHRRHAERSGVRALSVPAARQHESGLRPDDSQRQDGRLQPAGGADLVEPGHGPGDRIFHFPLPLLPR